MPNVKSLTVNGIKYDIKDAAARTAIAGKQDALVAGSNITINGNTISATDTTYTAGENITIENGVISATTGGGGGGSSLAEVLNAIYPVGSLYMGTMTTNPIAALMPNSTWRKVAGGKALWISNYTTDANTTIEAGLPNITASWWHLGAGAGASGAVSVTTASWGNRDANWNQNSGTYTLDASRSSSVFGKSDTVQPPAYVINVWRRVS